MKETITDVMPLWMLLMASFGFIIGLALGEELSRRRCAEQKVEDLRSLLKHPGPPALERQLKRMHGTLNDMHKLILAVSKGLQKPAS